MKNKVIFGIATILFFGCEKEPEPNTQIESYIDSGQAYNTKSQGNPQNDDAFLKQAIDGKISEYSDIDALSELLFENARLSDAVLKHAIKSENVPNTLLEMVVILSAPVHASTLQQLNLNRPSMSMSNINFAQANIESYDQFMIVNTPVKYILFGDFINIVENPTYKEINGENVFCECTRNVTYSGISMAIPYGTINGEEDFEPAQGCNSAKWLCGRPRALEDNGDNNYTIYCQQADEKCFRYPKKLR